MEQMTIAEIQENIVAEIQENIAAERPISGGYETISYAQKRGNFIITAMQNNTELVWGFWEALKNYAKHINAEIITSPILYNKNAWAQPDDIADNIWFAEKQYMENNTIRLNDNVLLIGSAHILPTAKNPLSGFQNIGEAGDYVILPASKIALECLPALKGEKAKTLYSTGTVTAMNYVQRKAGQVAETEHNFGAIVVEDGKNPRSIEWRNNRFYDFNGDYIYCSDNTALKDNILTLGDIHAEKCDIDRVKGMGNIIKALKPSRVFIHDLLDFTSRNHHSRENQFHRYHHDINGDSVKKDIAKARKIINLLSGYADDSIFHIIQSNHDLALDRWINEADWRDDTNNAEIYLKLALEKLRAIKDGKYFNALESAFNLSKCLARVYFGKTDESSKIFDIENGNHGDKGPNGSKGSLSAFRKIGQPMTIGHSHSPGISGNVYQVGVGGNMDMGYNQGPSSWRQAHCVAYSNGQRQIIFE